MNRFAISLSLACAAAAAPAAFAQQASGDHAAHHAPAAASAPSTGAPWVDAEVRKVDKSAGKITLRHGEIPNLGMPAMTMVFAVKDATLLERFKAGDQVRFSADQVSGQYVATRIEARP